MLSEKSHSKLWFYFTVIIFGTIMGTLLVAMIVWISLYDFQVTSVNPFERHVPFLMILAGSIFLGAMITRVVDCLMIRFLQNMSDAFGQVSKGDFSAHIPEDAKLDEMREIAKRFNSMVYDLSHIETLRNDFVVNVSHEFKTPIAAIEGYATLLQDEGLTEEKRGRYVDKILDNSRQLSHLSSNILALSKLENQEIVMHQNLYRLDEQLRKAVLLLENKWTPMNIEFDIELPKCIFFGNEFLLDQVWVNILDNAIKHSPAESVICVSIEEKDGKVFVAISDQGDGMEEEVQKHIFEKFYQGDKSRRAKGNGLGLALVKRIVDLYKGNIMVKSAPGQGTEFIVVLPK